MVIFWQVFEGNTYNEPLSSKVNYFTDGNITASLIRIWSVPSNESCIRLNVYGEPTGCKLYEASIVQEMTKLRLLKE